MFIEQTHCEQNVFYNQIV